MKRKRFIIWITIAVMLIAVTAAFAYGKARVDASAGPDNKSYFDSLNDYDWSRACPAAGCRNTNEEK